MRQFVFTLLLAFVTTVFAFGQDVKVRAYTRKDGTYVPSHYRTNPNTTNRDNYTTRPNTNPYNGKRGYITPDYRGGTTIYRPYYLRNRR